MISTILMAQAFPRSEFHGFDYHDKSIELAMNFGEASRCDGSRHIRDRRCEGICRKQLRLRFVFDCLHDMGDPVALAFRVRGAIKNDGSWMIVEPFATDDLQDNLNPVGSRVYYSFSTLLCTPCSRSKWPCVLGLRPIEKRMRGGREFGGFHRFRRATETPFNLVYEARP